MKVIAAARERRDRIVLSLWPIGALCAVTEPINPWAGWMVLACATIPAAYIAGALMIPEG